jgi:hypothetical protein
MRTLYQRLAPLMFAAILLSTVAITGCAPRVYDPYHHDYHRWNHDEIVYYQRWENETHRQHVDFSKRSEGDKKEYWDWRHSH